jgi:hypothetical protein
MPHYPEAVLRIRIGFKADPDPAFLSMRIRIRIQILGFGDQTLEKNLQLKKKFKLF